LQDDSKVTCAERTASELWLSGAAIVSVARFFHAAAPDYDIGMQIQAAQNLLAGHGLSEFLHLGQGLTDSATLATQIHFPAGYSIAAASLLALHFDVGMVVRIIGTAATLLGWWGWGTLAQSYFRDGLGRGRMWHWAAFAIATLTPVLFTPSWEGTDILLWAMTPWTVVWLGGEKRSPVSDSVVGGICGLAVLARYASVVLVLYAVAIIILQSQFRIQTTARRLTAFGITVVPLVAVQVYLNYFVAGTTASPVGVALGGGIAVAARRFWSHLSLLPNAHFPWVFWMPGIVLQRIVPDPADPHLWQLGITALAFTALLLAARIYWKGSVSLNDPRVLALGLLVAIPLELWVSTAQGAQESYAYLSNRRYYWPLIPLPVLVAYSIASVPANSTRSQTTHLLTSASRLYVVGFVTLTLFYAALMFTPNRLGATERTRLLATQLRRWPSLAVSYELSPARQFVIRQLDEQSDALLVTSTAGWFHADASIDQSKVFDLDCNMARFQYVTGPATIVILSFDAGEPRELWFPNEGAGSRRSLCFERLPSLELLRRFPDEGLKVLSARIEPGQRVMLKPEMSSANVH